jgi:hypothetical protein
MYGNIHSNRSYHPSKKVKTKKGIHRKMDQQDDSIKHMVENGHNPGFWPERRNEEREREREWGAGA